MSSIYRLYFRFCLKHILCSFLHYSHCHFWTTPTLGPQIYFLPGSRNVGTGTKKRNRNYAIKGSLETVNSKNAAFETWRRSGLQAQTFRGGDCFLYLYNTLKTEIRFLQHGYLSTTQHHFTSQYSVAFVLSPIRRWMQLSSFHRGCVPCLVILEMETRWHANTPASPSAVIRVSGPPMTALTGTGAEM